MLMQNYSKGVNQGINTGIQGATNLFNYFESKSVEDEWNDSVKKENNATGNKGTNIDLYANYPTLDNVNFEVGNPSTDIFNTPDINQAFA